MALPKNKYLRKLTIEDLEYYWKVEDDTSDFRGLVVSVGMVLQPYKRFVFDFRFDHHRESEVPGKSIPNINQVTPKLIKESIAFA